MDRRKEPTVRQSFTPSFTFAILPTLGLCLASRPVSAQPSLVEQLEPRPVFATSRPAQPSASSRPALSPPAASQPATTTSAASTQPSATTAAPTSAPVENVSKSPTDSPTDSTAPAVSEEIVLGHLQTRFERVAMALTPATVALRVVRAPLARATSSAETPGPIFGSAIIVSSDGLLVTCEHVVRGALTVDATLSDGRQYRASVLGADPRTDVALLRIRVAGLVPVALSDAGRLRRGHLVFASGFPAELAGSREPAVTQGMVCATGRPLPATLGAADDRDYGDMIQFTAPVSPGFSGGPLMDLGGRVVGMVTVNEGGASGIFGYARPVGPRFLRIINRLSRGESIDYGYIGVSAGDLTEPLARQLGISRLDGAAVHLVEPGGAADRAGLAEDDVIVSLNGVKISTAVDLIERTGDLPPGSTAVVDYLRGGRMTRAQMLVGRRQMPVGGGETPGVVEFRGATLAPADDELRQMANYPADAMVVTVVREGSPAGRAGLSPGDVVVRFQGATPSGRRVTSLAHSRDDVLLGMASGGSVLVGSD